MVLASSLFGRHVTWSVLLWLPLVLPWSVAPVSTVTIQPDSSQWFVCRLTGSCPNVIVRHSPSSKFLADPFVCPQSVYVQATTKDDSNILRACVNNKHDAVGFQNQRSSYIGYCYTADLRGEKQESSPIDEAVRNATSLVQKRLSSLMPAINC